MRSWQLEHGSSANDLESAVKAVGIAAVPIDPFSNAPLENDGRQWADRGLFHWTGWPGQRRLDRMGPQSETARGNIIFRLPPLSLQANPATFAARKWTDKSGKFNVTAELIDVVDGKAPLRKQNGKVLTIPTERLSEADQTYLREHPSHATVTP